MGSRFLAVALAISLATPAVARVAPDGPESPALPVLKTAMASEKSKDALTASLAEVDALIVKNPKDPIAHYTRGWILSRLARPQDAVAAYDKAFALDKSLGDAAYNAGVVLGGMGKPKDAVVRFDRALEADDTHADAAYNAGQGYYDQGNFAKAAARWETAAKLSPEDFQIAKKLVQAYVGLGKADKVKTARARVFKFHADGKVPGKAKDYVYDQFKVGKYHVYVHETFDTSGSLAYVYSAKPTLNDKPVGSVNLETSAVIREQGVPFVIGIDYPDGKHETLNTPVLKTADYPAFKKLAQKLIAEKF